MDGRLPRRKMGNFGFKVDVVADHGTFDACADPTNSRVSSIFAQEVMIFPALQCEACIPIRHPWSGYRCSFRVTEAVYLIGEWLTCSRRSLTSTKLRYVGKPYP